MSTISDGTTTVPLLLILGWVDQQDGANVQHLIIGSAAPDYTIHPARARSGTMQIVMASMAAGWQLRALLVQAKTFTVVNTELPGANMQFVISDGGTVSVALDQVTQVRGVVSVDFSEVKP